MSGDATQPRAGRALQIMKLVEQYGGAMAGIEMTTHFRSAMASTAADLYNRINALAQEMGADADRYTWVSRRMSIDDIGDDSAVYALVVDSEGLEEEAARAKCWVAEEFMDCEPSVDDAIDAAMKDMKA